VQWAEVQWIANTEELELIIYALIGSDAYTFLLAEVQSALTEAEERLRHLEGRSRREEGSE
jgi:hypothetical protein